MKTIQFKIDNRGYEARIDEGNQVVELKRYSEKYKMYVVINLATNIDPNINKTITDFLSKEYMEQATA